MFKSKALYSKNHRSAADRRQNVWGMNMSNRMERTSKTTTLKGDFWLEILSISYCSVWYRESRIHYTSVPSPKSELHTKSVLQYFEREVIKLFCTHSESRSRRSFNIQNYKSSQRWDVVHENVDQCLNRRTRIEITERSKWNFINHFRMKWNRDCDVLKSHRELNFSNWCLLKKSIEP